jgi:phage-related protein
VSATVTCPFVPSYSTVLNKEPNVRTVQLGDNYVQRAGRGINNNGRKYSLQFTVQSDAQADKIEAFFDAMGSTTPFLLYIPGSDFTDTQAFFGLGDGVRTQFQIQRTKIPEIIADANNPKFWPQVGEGFYPVTKLNADPTIYKNVSGTITTLVKNTDYTITSTNLVITATAPSAGTKMLYSGSGGNWGQYVATKFSRSFDGYSNNTVTVEIEEDFS